MVGKFKHATLRDHGSSPHMIPGEEFKDVLSEGFQPVLLWLFDNRLIDRMYGRGLRPAQISWWVLITLSFDVQ
jgi:hypothetical protein